MLGLLAMNRRRYTNGLEGKQVIVRLGLLAMNRRRYTNGLAGKQVEELLRGWEHACRIGFPLNVLISIRPVEDHSSNGFCALAAGVRNKLGVYARQHTFPFVAAWVRECNTDCNGEHLHVLMHVPPKHLSHLRQKIVGWFPAPEAVDVRAATQKVFVARTGIRMSAIGYLVKQMTPRAWYRRRLIRKAGGPILGKRGGVTQNIGRKAIQQYFELAHPVRAVRRQSQSKKEFAESR
jgi:hypothetical protein